ncbi:F-box/FBD/LRR-repeat protein, partial [Mucuna pruriens]
MKNQKRKKQRVLKCNKDDYISKLPNDILCKILSSLTVKEAVKTSVLSSKWKHLYANPINLTFDEVNMLKRDHFASNVWHYQSEVLRFIFKYNRTLAFVSNVNQYLSHVGQVQKIDKLNVCFTFCHNGYNTTDLDQWIRLAIKGNVEEIDLCLMEEEHLSPPYDVYVFPCDVVGNEGGCAGAGASGFKSYLKHLRLAHCVLAPHKHYNTGFSTLTTMELFKVDLKSEEHIQFLLSSCNNLEWLGLSKCYNMENLRIEHPFCQKLKFLNVNFCQQLKALVLHSASLETLEYVGEKVEFSFDAPRLTTFYSRVSDSTACHREVWPVCRLPYDLPQLETLIMECNCSMGEVMTRRLHTFTFPRLRHLEIIEVARFRQDPWWVAKILELCPILGRLELHLRSYFCIDEETRKSDGHPRCPHNHLKEVVITGFRGHSSEIEIAILLLRNGIALEKMTIDPRSKSYRGNGKWDHSEACENWNREVRQMVHKLLKQEANSAVELLIK